MEMPHAPRYTRSSVLLPRATLDVIVNCFHFQLSEYSRRFETTFSCRSKCKLDVNCWLTASAWIVSVKMVAGCQTRLRMYWREFEAEGGRTLIREPAQVVRLARHLRGYPESGSQNRAKIVLHKKR